MNTAHRRVAVVGSGVSGLLAAHVLGKQDHVTLYEADDRLGGHADTHDVEVGEHTLGIDTGFIVHNERTYPTLLRLFDELGVPTQESDMSMSVSDRVTGLEWAGALGAKGLFPAASNLRNPRYLRMLTEIPRFHRRAKALLETPDDGADGFETGASAPTSVTDMSLGEFLRHENFSDFFVETFMTPLVAAVWSTDPDHALEYPARYLFAFLEHHGMLTVFGSPTWRTVAGGSREYVDRVAKSIDEIRLSAPVSVVRESADGVEVTDPSGTTTYDAVVIATHAEQALAMLAEPTDAHREVLGAIRYQPNLAQLHTDERLLPVADGARASWNYQRRPESQPGDGRVLVTYDLTRLQRLPVLDGRRFLVTLNAKDVVDPSTVVAEMPYAHPIYDPATVAAQRRLPELNTSRVAFAGAYHGWGFHEDGALSGLRAAEHLGGQWPVAERRSLPPVPRLYETEIKHTRVAPLSNAFTYRSSTWLVDLDDLPRYGGAFGPLLRRLSRFEARDHVGDPSLSLRENIDTVLAEHGIELGAGGRVLMLAHPRTLGYVFNPISVYWCYTGGFETGASAPSSTTGRLAGVVVEVHNTYGGRHAYVVHPDERGRARVAKELYVSPFNDTSGEYHVAVPEPGDEVAVTVTLHREDQPPFVATMTGVAGPTAARDVVRAGVRHPVVPLLGMIRIKFQGIKLWLRGLRVQPRPSNHGSDQ